ncbi:IclR family transcriptional regulator [Halogeometricum sp. CBA1124]|uniref:IclR family transcriptional regulator n=1 Tax=Halogeometricum sp. CBA1124 TaxID=2668071 RepID=UPI00142C755D|nr:IclR family transcriptional regulator [Halogeometricum sp. CBA1124]MUV56816.1 helix-turn-helix domain-containing protein [Halogeometricum sp. CBA1124]
MNQNTPLTDEQPTSHTIKSVHTTFRIVESLITLNRPTITNIADYTNLAKSTVHKHLATLIEESCVTKIDDEYHLGARFLDLGGHVRNEKYGSEIVKDKVKSLAEKTGQVVHFVVEEHGRAVVIYREKGEYGVPSRSRVGKRMSLHQTAYGKAILAHLPEERISEIIDFHGLPSATKNTVTDSDELRQELEQIRERGYAINDEESTVGLSAVGAPVMLDDGTVFAGCSIAGPENEIKEDQIDDLLSTVNQIKLAVTYS